MWWTLLLLWAGTACVPLRPSQPPSATGEGPAQPARTLVAAVLLEPKTLGARIIGQSGASLGISRRMFNADLALLDDQSNPHPYLDETLPQLNSADWKVFPDGTMETTYHLRPNLVWHDGTPLTPDDFIFSWQVYTTPEVGQTGSLPIKIIAGIEAPDDRTVVIHWTRPYAAAGALQSLGNSGPLGLPPLSRSILGPALDSGAQALVNNAFWTTGYVGLGPYSLDRWEPGAFLEASSFDRHALGPAPIQRIKLVFMPDANAVLASMLAGEIQLAGDQALPLPQATALLRRWPAGEGAMVLQLTSWLATHFQGRRELASPAALWDRRVRRALAYAVDRPGINDALFEGQLPIVSSWFPPTSDLGRAVEAAAPKYPFDLARSTQLMAEAGFTRGRSGFYADPRGEEFTVEVRTDSARNVQTQSALASGWRHASFDFQEMVIPPSQAQDLQLKSSYPGLLLSSIGAGEIGLNGMGTDNIAGPENQWRGSAWDGHSNPEFDRLIGVFGAALDPSERTRAAVEIVRMYDSDMPAISLFFSINSTVFVSDLSGPLRRPAESNVSWNLHEWHFTRERGPG